MGRWIWLLASLSLLSACTPARLATPAPPTPTALPAAVLTETPFPTPTLTPTSTPTPGPPSLDKAQQALITFFDLLHNRRYAEAIRYYGGSYDVLRDWNPPIPEDDYAALFEMGCMVNGLQCLPVKRIVHGEQVSPTEFVFVVEFMNEDGSLFVRGPCCGATEAEMPPQTRFTFTVAKVGDRFLVQELPVLVP